MARIVFVNPPLTPQERYHNVKAVGDFVPPIGLCNLAAMTREQGFDTQIVDCSALSLSHGVAAETVMATKPRYVGITAVTLSIYNAASVAGLIKQMDPSVVTIIGGPHLTAVPEQTMKLFPQFDIGVMGEGDITICELLKTLEAGSGLSDVPGLIYREGGKLVETGRRPYIKNLDTLPLPAWDLLPDLREYYKVSELGQHREPATSLITSRGCPYSCTFCSSSVYGTSARAYGAEYVMKMIHHLYYEYGVRDIEIRDENLLVFKPRLKAICEQLIREKLDLIWDCNARVNLVDPEILQLMKRAGCWQIAYGIESGSQTILDSLSKGITLEQVEQALEWTHAAGIKARGFFMIGSPGETKETIEATIDFTCKIRLDSFNMSYFTPLPGSPVYAEAEGLGAFESDWRKMNVWTPIFVPHGLTREDLVRYRKKAVRAFYLRPRTIVGFLKMTKRPENIAKLFKGGIVFARVMSEK